MTQLGGQTVTLRVEIRPQSILVIDVGGFLLGDLHKNVVQAWDNETLGAVVRSLLESLSFDWRRRS